MRRLRDIMSTPELRRKVALWAGYVLFFVVTFLLFTYWTFPYDRLRDWIVQRVEYSSGPGGTRRPSGWELEIVELSPSWLTGFELTGVRLVKVPEGPGERPVDVNFEHIETHLSVLTLLGGGLGGSFDAQVAKGRIHGDIAHSRTRTSVDARIRNVHLRRVPILRLVTGLPIAGKSNGRIDLTVAEKVANTKGKIEIDVDNMTIGDGKSKLKLEGMNQGLTVEKMALGDLAARVDVEEGVARIDTLRARGKDASFRGAGTVRLLKPLQMSRLDLMVRIKFTDSYRNRNDRTRALFSLMEFNPRLRKARTEDGALQWRINGSFGARVQSQAAGNAEIPGGG